MAFEALTTPWGFPCFVRFPCVHAAATTPEQRLNLSLRSFPPDVSVFPDSRVDPRIVLFEDCSAFTRCGLYTRAVTNS